jgi:hypothetical protein
MEYFCRRCVSGGDFLDSCISMIELGGRDCGLGRRESMLGP